MIWILAAVFLQDGEWEELRAIWRELPRPETPYDFVDGPEVRVLRTRLDTSFRWCADPLSKALHNVLLGGLPEAGTRKHRTDPRRFRCAGQGVFKADLLAGLAGSGIHKSIEEGLWRPAWLDVVSESSSCWTWLEIPRADELQAQQRIRRALSWLSVQRPAWLERRLVRALWALDTGAPEPEFAAPTAEQVIALRLHVVRLDDDDIAVRDEAQVALSGPILSHRRREAVVTFLLEELDRATDPEVRARLQDLLDSM